MAPSLLVLKKFQKKLHNLRRKRSAGSLREPSVPVENADNLRSAVIKNPADGYLGYPDYVCQIFRLFDKNADGRISREELEAMALAIHMADPTLPKEEAIEVLAETDVDADGYTEFREFAEFLMGKESESGGDAGCGDEVLKEAFAAYDRDGDGIITAEDLHAVLPRLLPAKDWSVKMTMFDCQHMISAVGRSGDGGVRFQEFATMLTGTPRKSR